MAAVVAIGEEVSVLELLGSLLFWEVVTVVGLASLVVVAFVWGRRPVAGRAGEILKERYARGEFSREEFERMRREIGA